MYVCARQARLDNSGCQLLRTARLDTIARTHGNRNMSGRSETEGEAGRAKTVRCGVTCLVPLNFKLFNRCVTRERSFPQPGADTDVNRLKLGLAETIYRSSKRESLGKGYQRGHQLPQKVRTKEQLKPPLLWTILRYAVFAYDVPGTVQYMEITTYYPP